MKITNRFNLPEAFYNFARKDKYSKGEADISVTTLIDSPRIRLMRDRFADSLETDAVDMIWSLFGTAVHHVLESTEDTATVTTEERLYADVAGWVLSGAIDHQQVLPDGTIQVTDYKVTSAWSVILGKDEWVQQQNCYAYLLEANGRKVSSIRICAILRDWQRRKAEFDKEYPQSPVVIVDLPLWSAADREEYVYERIMLHQEAQAEWDLYDNMALCTEKEQWAKPAQWAVHKKGGKRAVKLCDSEEQAKEYIEESNGKDKLEIQFRPGERTRCDGNYCNVAEFCEQYQGWKKS
jgi:hypothetical protein